MITINIQDEQIQQAFNKSVNDMLVPGNYNNPVKTVLDNLLGYSGAMKGEVGEQIKLFVETQLKSESFQTLLGKAIAEEMARRAVDAMEKKK
jgi:hypothetical protein